MKLLRRLVSTLSRVRSSLREMEDIQQEARTSRLERRGIPTPPRGSRDFSRTLEPPYWKHRKEST